MSKELNKYIKKELKKGFSLKQIRNTLLKDGYKKDTVSEALSQFKEIKPRVSFDFPWEKLFLILSVLVVLLVLSFFVYKFINKTPKIEEPSISTFLPTVEYFNEEGWVMKYDGSKSLYWPEEQMEIARRRGFIEGYVRTFYIENRSSSDTVNSLVLSFSLSRYPRENISQVMERMKNELQNNGVDYSQLPNQLEVEEGKVITLWDEGIESFEITNNKKNKCIRFIREDIWTQVCCTYYKEAWEETCSDHLFGAAGEVSFKIEEYYNKKRKIQ